MPERIANSVSEVPRSWVASTIVLVTASLFVLTVSRAPDNSLQRVIESTLHNSMTMAACAVALYFARRGMFGRLPSILKVVSAFLLPSFILFSILGLALWPVFWEVVKPLGLVRDRAAPIVVFGSIALWCLSLVWVTLRGMIRWLRNRYEHHGVALGLGPVYFYFRRRRV